MRLDFRYRRKRERESRYLRAESAAAAVDYAPEGLVPSVRQHVPFQPPPRTRTPPLHLATLPLAHEVVAPRLGVDVSYLKIRFQCTINRLHRILSHLAFCPFLRNESSKNRAGLALIHLQMFEKFAARLEALLALVPPAHAAVGRLLPVLLRLPGRESYGGRGREYRRKGWFRAAAPRVLLLLLDVVLVLALFPPLLGYGQPLERVVVVGLGPERAEDAPDARHVVVLVHVRREDATLEGRGLVAERGAGRRGRGRVRARLG